MQDKVSILDQVREIHYVTSTRSAVMVDLEMAATIEMVYVDRTRRHFLDLDAARAFSTMVRDGAIDGVLRVFPYHDGWQVLLQDEEGL